MSWPPAPATVDIPSRPLPPRRRLAPPPRALPTPAPTPAPSLPWLGGGSGLGVPSADRRNSCLVNTLVNWP